MIFYNHNIYSYTNIFKNTFFYLLISLEFMHMFAMLHCSKEKKLCSDTSLNVYNKT